jgi:hypothetical protein
MTSRLVLLIPAVLVLCSHVTRAQVTPVHPAPATEAATTPEVAQLREQFAQQKYADVLRNVARLLALRGESAKAYDRYELFTLRGEAYLRTKAPSVAAEAFKSAAKETKDPVQQARAQATGLLIRRSKATGYVPRTAAKPADSNPPALTRAKLEPSLPIVEEADRKIALEALLADEMAVIEPKLKAATSATSLVPIIEATKALSDIRVLELAASGKDDRTKALSADLGTHAHQLISPEVRSMSTRVEQCWQSGSRERYATDRAGGVRDKLYGLYGLNSTEQGDLKKIIQTCQKLAPAAKELAAAVGTSELDIDAQSASDVLARASEVLEYDYPNEGRYNKKRTTTAKP